jgi:hypothetical protein
MKYGKRKRGSHKWLTLYFTNSFCHILATGNNEYGLHLSISKIHHQAVKCTNATRIRKNDGSLQRTARRTVVICFITSFHSDFYLRQH